MSRYFTARKIAKIAILSAMAYVLYLINIPLSFLFPSFLKINLSDVPSLIGGFSMGPIAGAIIVFVKVLLKLPFSGTLGVGEFSDLINGLAFTLVSSFIYKTHKTKKGALVSMAFGALASIITALLCNLFIMIPLYLKVMGMSLEEIAAFCPKAFNVTAENFYVYYTFGSVLPFNILRCTLCFAVTFFLYKSLMKIINRIGE